MEPLSALVEERSATQPTQAAGTQSRRTPRVRRQGRREWVLFLLFIGPNLLLFGVFSYWPMLYNVYLSAVRWDLIAPLKTPVGLDNYRYLASDPAFREVLQNTLVFTVSAVGISLALGLALALLLNQPLRGRDTARAVLFAPTLLSGAAISITGRGSAAGARRVEGAVAEPRRGSSQRSRSGRRRFSNEAVACSRESRTPTC